MQVRNRVYTFSGPFAELSMDYIKKHRDIGYKYKIDEVYLRQFDNFCIGKIKSGDPLTKELFDEWTLKVDYESPTTHKMRYDVLSKFCKYLYANGESAYIGFYPMQKISHKNNFTPYIFTQEEISRFFIAADSVKSSKQSPIMHHVLPLLFRILYGSGLRLSEVLNLKIADVDLDVGTLKINDTKFDKSRIVPMSPSLKICCEEYLKNVKPFLSLNGYFFPSIDDGPFAPCTIYTRYRNVLFEAGISHGGRGKGPRIHDFRHTFAVNSLRKLVGEGQDIYVTLPILCNYLGHKTIGSTQKYLRLTAEIYPELTQSFEKHFGMVFPEVVL